MSIPPHHIIGDLGHTTDHNSIVDVLSLDNIALAGPPFVSVEAFDSVAESLINDCSSTSGGSPSSGTFFNSNAGAAVSVTTTAGQFTQGTSAINGKGLNLGLENNPYLTSNFGVNFGADISIGTRSHVAVDLRPSWSGGGLGLGPVEFFELVVSSTVATLSGGIWSWADATTIALPVPASLNTSATYYTVYLPVHQLTALRSLGVRSKRYGIGGAKSGSMTWMMDNIRWAEQSELDRALRSAAEVTAVIPSSFTSAVTQRAFVPQTGQGVTDLRQNPKRVTAREAQIYPEDGSADVTAALSQVLHGLPDGGVFEFTPGAIYRLAHSVLISDRNNITIEGNNATLVRPVTVNDDFFTLKRLSGAVIRNLKFVGYNQEDWAQGASNAIESNAGSPTLSGGLATLTSQNDSVRLTESKMNAPFGRNEYGRIPVEVTLYDTSGTDHDVLFEWYDRRAPATGPSALTQMSGGGGVPAGTWYYRVSFVDAEGNETGLSPATSITTSAYSMVSMTIPTATNAVGVEGTNGPPWVKRRVYGTGVSAVARPWDARSYAFLGEVPDNTTTTFVDTAVRASSATSWTPSLADTGTGNLSIGTYRYYVSTVDGTTGQERLPASGVNGKILTTRNAQITVGNLPAAVNGGVRRIYRSVVDHQAQAGGAQYGFWLADVSNTAATSYVDNASDATLLAGYGNRHAPTDITSNSDGVQAGAFGEVFTITGRSGSPQTIRWEHTPFRNDRELGFRITKRTSASDPIVISNVRTFGRTHYDTNFENMAGVSIQESCVDVRLEYCDMELMSGDAAQVAAGSDTNDIVIDHCVSRCARRQGMTVASGMNIRLTNVRILESARTGIDLEPTFLTMAESVVMEDVEFRSITNNAVTGHAVPRVYMKGCWMHNSHGALGGPVLLGANCSIENCDFRWNIVQLSGRDLYIDGLAATRVILSNQADTQQGLMSGFDGGINRAVVRNVRLTGTSNQGPALENYHPKALIQNVSIGVDEAIPLPTTMYAPISDTQSAVMTDVDLGVFRETYPDTFKAPIGGDLWFPRGLDLRREGLRRTRAISMGDTPGNHLWGTAVISGGATTATVSFPYTESVPDISNFTINGTTGGTMTAGTYRYRVVARNVLGGPTTATIAEKSVTLTTATAVVIAVTGIRSGTSYMEGVTVYRTAVGGSAGNYTTRYDVVPTDDTFFLGSDSTNTHLFKDLGTTLQALAGDTLSGTGYSDAITATSTTGFPTSSWDGSKWIVALELGFEPNATYAVILQPWWGTTAWMTAGRRDGFDVAFGTAAPPGSQRLDWFIVR